MKSRLSRSNAMASVQRAIHEPTSHHTDLGLAQDLLRAADSLIGSVLTLEGYLVDNPSRCALPMVTDFCKSVDEELQFIATALRERQSLTEFPNLQEALRCLQERKSGHLAKDECRTALRLVMSEGRRMVATLNGVKELLGEGFGILGGGSRMKK